MSHLEDCRQEWEEAWSDQLRFEEQGGSRGDFKNGPFFRWWCLAVIVPNLSEQYEAGNNKALFTAIDLCAIHDFRLPAWVRDGFHCGYEAVNDFKLNSWDKAFGLPHGKHANLAAMRRRRALRFDVLMAVRALHESDPTRYPIGDYTFGEVGKQSRFHKNGRAISASTVRNLFYEGQEYANPLNYLPIEILKVPGEDL
ncbi:MAG TPA: hypothetical protein VK130_08580 [Steroidobacteraceae bacterium]|nr:hypothetical protein [Steroidobacteraceae bacterium]